MTVWEIEYDSLRHESIKYTKEVLNHERVRETMREV